VTDIAALMNEVKEKITQEPNRFFRIGTWELGDSLALEHVYPSAARLVEEFSTLDNAMLELKTKSNCVEPILGLKHRGRTVVSWSMNPDCVIRQEEHRTARLAERLEGLEKVLEDGYLVGFHFDPMIFFHGWEAAYEDLIRRIFEITPSSKIAWISIGSLRFNPEMKKMIDIHYPGNTLTSKEMVVGKDHKCRYIKPLRLSMYKNLYKWICHYGSKDLFIYLCMEAGDLWEKVFEFSPESISHLDFLMAESLYRRFEGLVREKPKRGFYEI